jgi:alkanesulfonate monooxygenase SsuD/methylene tetrahydromethanopterin reductase-like flavin-dependent oxidoreductase (luciferase family)
MILHFGSSRSTRDVDVLVLRGDLGKLRQSVKATAQEHNLPDDWMSDAAKGFTNILPPDFHHRLVPLDLPFQHLHLYVLGQPEQVAMKIVALREQDLEDLELLLPLMSETDKEVLMAVMHHVAKSRPDWAQKIRYFLLEQGWEIE